jgi:hypothetical protein
MEWLPYNQQSLDKTKMAIEPEVLLTYLEFIKQFHIENDASNNQLGTVVMQNKESIALPQATLMEPNNYDPTTESELLYIIETCK